MTTTAEDAQKARDEAIRARNIAMAAREKELNAGKTGKGLRTFLGMTRGRNPQEIQFEQWDDSQPDTLPTSLSEFMDLRKISDEKDIMRRLILGDNDVLYSEASDPVAEFLESDWSLDTKTRFKVMVKNFAAMNDISIEDAVNLIKPVVVAQQAKK